MKIELDLNRGISVLLPITSFVLYVVLVLEIIIKDCSINHHLLQRFLLKHFSTIRVHYLSVFNFQIFC
ncbi:hypothetical protein CXB51_019641 [Gossypium anomalum]|uniref:Uncharacterized protein n=1 Tax=Gossypium anomalum TaxID=47600 RepID=A0A8J6CXW1_9ROSI|nr:hypothetical protein CXB51_019641 [Gossypium anomalum]